MNKYIIILFVLLLAGCAKKQHISDMCLNLHPIMLSKGDILCAATKRQIDIYDNIIKSHCIDNK